MRISELRIAHLRNLRDITLTLSPGINLFSGSNGSGKTSLLEAVHLAAHGRSFRSGPVSELITHGEDSVLVRIVGDKATIALERPRSGEPVLKVGGERVRRMSEATRFLPVQTLLPGVSDLVFGPPGGRREWLDWGLFHVEHGYHDTLRRYQRVLTQRNAALKQVALGQQPPSWTTTWDKEFVELAEKLTTARENYLRAVAPAFLSKARRLLPSIGLAWEFQAGDAAGQSLSEQMVVNLSREVKSGSTIAGPHRADVVLLVTEDPAPDRPGFEPSAGDDQPAGLDSIRRAATHVLSRGQGKLVAAAMKLAQADYLAAKGGSSGVLLLDDVGAELDLEHTRRLLDLVLDYPGQVVATSTELQSVLSTAEREVKRFHVKHGEVEERPETGERPEKLGTPPG